MTTIAATRSTIAGDQQYNTPDGTKLLGAPKIWEVSGDASQALFGVKRVLFGFAGAAMYLYKVQQYLQKGGKPPRVRDVELIAVDGKSIWYGTNLNEWLEVKQPTFAIGSGRAFALAAMEAGKSPLEAVKIASKHDIYTGMKFGELSM